MRWQGSRSWVVSEAAAGPGLRLTADPSVVLDCFLINASNELDIPLMRHDATAAPARGAVVQVFRLTSTICNGFALRRHYEYFLGWGHDFCAVEQMETHNLGGLARREVYTRPHG